MPRIQHLLSMLLVIFWLSSVVNCVHKHIHTKLLASFTGHRQGFCCLHGKHKVMWGRPLSPLTMHVASISINTSAVDFLYYIFIKATIISESCASCRNCQVRMWRTEGGTFAQDKMNIWANAPSPLLPQSSVQKRGGGAHFGELTVL